MLVSQCISESPIYIIRPITHSNVDSMPCCHVSHSALVWKSMNQPCGLCVYIFCILCFVHIFEVLFTWPCCWSYLGTAPRDSLRPSVCQVIMQVWSRSLYISEISSPPHALLFHSYHLQQMITSYLSLLTAASYSLLVTWALMMSSPPRYGSVCWTVTWGLWSFKLMPWQARCLHLSQPWLNYKRAILGIMTFMGGETLNSDRYDAMSCLHT